MEAFIPFNRVIALSLIFLLLPFGAEAAPLNAQNQKIRNCLSSLKRWVRDSYSVDELIERGREQEAIWTLRENKLHIEADALETKVTLKMYDGFPIGDPKFALGSFNKGKFTLSTGVSGLFKPNEYALEVLAYEIDKALGLNRVPITIFREIEGEMGSFQFWIEGSSTLSNPLNILRGGIVDEREREFFNYLIGRYNDHESPNNILFSRNGRGILIDNQLSFHLETQLDAKVKDLIPRKEIYDRLKSWTDEDIDLLLSNYKPIFEVEFSLVVRAFKERREKLLWMIERYVNTVGPEKAFDIHY